MFIGNIEIKKYITYTGKMSIKLAYYEDTRPTSVKY